ncbi:AraC family transcriptional regulator [Clostridium bowmanii]|uniref:AraC family transcriptional regulator n=1 Tax=Clostridium bowmanii TaxID=132925 RepID=UPI001C0D2644|nr:AraC family transcriptional regulator [Clostridium bowmanii]MBU3191052.1 AraC family transcriptional regulator [Clostridium bowmanii]MCA1075376.1 AraC family transcriptional regulator [Clostridium bowmanii]
MCDLKIDVDNFNPKMLYTFVEKFNDKSNLTYHCHDFMSIIYILAGTCTYNISGVPHIVKKGDLLIFNPNVYHGKILPTDSEINEFQVGFQNFNIEGLLPNHFLESTTLKEKGILNLENYDKTTIVNTVLEFINDNYMYNLSLDVISKNMYLSPVYISKIFKESTGDSPINYLIKLRLSKAKSLLEIGDQAINKVCIAVGYADVYYFSKLFKKYYGCSPSKLKHSSVCDQLIQLNS